MKLRSFFSSDAFKETGNWLIGLLAALAAMLIFVQLSDTAMWRDEMQTWVIARDAGSLGALWKELGYEGFPPLWFFITKAVQLLTDNPSSMLFLHGAIACLNLFLIWRYAPFPFWVRGLLLLSYPLTVQYALFSRCYAITITFLMAALIARDKGKTFLYWLFLGLGGQATLLGLNIACGLAFQRFLLGPKKLWQEWKGVTLFCAFVLFAIIVAWPAPDRLLTDDIAKNASVLGFFAKSMTLFSGPFTGTSTVGVGVTCLLVLLGLGVALWRWRSLAAFAAILASFLFVDQIGYPLIQHHLLLLPLALVFVIWQEPRPTLLVQNGAMVLLLAVLALMGVDRLADFTQPVPRSQSRNVAGWIKENRLDQAFWIAVPDYTAVPVSGYLGRKFYFPQCKCERGAPRWSKNSDKVPALTTALAQAKEVMEERGLHEAYLLLGNVWSEQEQARSRLPEGMKAELLRAFAPSQFPDESYQVVRLQRE
ncbi:MAG: hypothetical protein AB7E52_04600 [Bdellovibrionales bacterium]